VSSSMPDPLGVISLSDKSESLPPFRLFLFFIKVGKGLERIQITEYEQQQVSSIISVKKLTLLRPWHCPEIPEILKVVLKCPEMHYMS